MELLKESVNAVSKYYVNSSLYLRINPTNRLVWRDAMCDLCDNEQAHKSGKINVCNRCAMHHEQIFPWLRRFGREDIQPNCDYMRELKHQSRNSFTLLTMLCDTNYYSCVMMSHLTCELCIRDVTWCCGSFQSTTYVCEHCKLYAETRGNDIAKSLAIIRHLYHLPDELLAYLFAEYTCVLIGNLDYNI